MEENKLERWALRLLILYDGVVVLTVSAIILVLVVLIRNGSEPIFILALIGVLLAVLAAGTVLLSRWFGERITKPLSELTNSLQSSDPGNSNKSVPIMQTGDELEALSRALRSFCIKARSLDQKSNRQLVEQSGSRAAADMLRSMRELLGVPAKPDFIGKENIGVAAIAENTGGRSGDFCDYFALHDGRMGFVAASTGSWDMPRALYLLSARAAVRSAMTAESNLSRAITVVSRNLFESGEMGKLDLAAFVGTIDAESGEVEYINAGYTLPLIIKEDGTIADVSARTAETLGSRDNLCFEAEKEVLGLGERLVLCSAAATENPEIGLSREKLADLLAAARTQPELQMMLGSVCAGIKKVSGGIPLRNNLAMLAIELRRNGRSDDELEIPSDPRSFGIVRQLVEERVNVEVWPKKDYARLCVAAEALLGIVCEKTDKGTITVSCKARRCSKEVAISFTAGLHHLDPLEGAESPEAQGAVRFLCDSATVSFSPGKDGDCITMLCSVSEA